MPLNIRNRVCPSCGYNMNPAFSERCDRCGKPFRAVSGAVKWLGLAVLLGLGAYGGSELYQKKFSGPPARPVTSPSSVPLQFETAITSAPVGSSGVEPEITASTNSEAVPVSSASAQAVAAAPASAAESRKEQAGMFSRFKKIWFDKVNGFVNGLGFGAKDLPPAEPDRTHALYSRERAREVREMVLVESGTFVLGSFAAGRYDENPASSAAYADAFFIDRYEVTVASFMVCVASGACQPPPGNTGCNWGDDKAAYPVNCVTWQNAADFCQWAGKRLPYEAEWEKAARAGSGKDYFFGDKADDLELYGWYKPNSEGETHPVGQLAPNPKGLYDIYGNVWEWTQDRYSKNAYGDITGSATPRGPQTGDKRVMRGGSFGNTADALRSAFRNKDMPGIISPQRGLRCAADVLE